MPASVRRRDLLVVAAFAVLVLAPWWAKPYHVDEQFFLAVAAHIRTDPWHPFAFDYNWYGQRVPVSWINNTPPLLDYLLAGDLLVSGGREWLMRALLLPFDLVSALALYLIAARFLRRPLLPALIVVAAPAFIVNINHLMAEKPMAAFSFSALYLLVRGLDDNEPACYWASGACFALALLSKYNAIFLAFPVFAYSYHRRQPWGRMLGYFALAGSGVAVFLALNALASGGALHSAWRVTADASRMFWMAWPHRLRSFLSFVGGCGVVTALWPAFLRRRPALLAACLAACAVLFLPALDLAPLVRPIDRLTGFLLSSFSLYGLALLFLETDLPGWALWAPWVLSVTLLQVGFYWSIMARFVLFLLPPLIFGLAAVLERDWAERPARRAMAASLAGTLALSFLLAKVDFDYARAQKAAAQRLASDYIAAGRRVWCAAHWGLQHYLEAAGGKEMDWSRGGWRALLPGDVLVLTRVNTEPIPPHPPMKARVHGWTVGEAIPLRLMSGWSGEGGFYASVMGFLPYSLSREPLEEFTVVEVLGPGENHALTHP